MIDKEIKVHLREGWSDRCTIIGSYPSPENVQEAIELLGKVNAYNRLIKSIEFDIRCAMRLYGTSDKPNQLAEARRCLDNFNVVS
jgi:hypothetical protein